MDIIDSAALASYLRTEQDDTIAQLAEFANALVTEEWRTPVEPAPVRVQMITLEAAARAYRNPRGLTSITRTADGSSRTERYAERDQIARAGVYLTDAELASLNPRRRRIGSIRLRVPGVG